MDARQAAWAAAALFGLALAGRSGDVQAQARCRVSDPTGTPLNVRAAPNGAILGQIRNGTLVIRDADAPDERGRTWTRIREPGSGRLLGWVFREFVSCF